MTGQTVAAPPAHNRATEVLSGSNTLRGWMLCSAAAMDALGHRLPCSCWGQGLGVGRGPHAALAVWQPGWQALECPLPLLRQLLSLAGLQGLGAQTLQGLQAAQQQACKAASRLLPLLWQPVGVSRQRMAVGLQ